METLLLLASSQKKYVQIGFTAFVLALVFISSVAIDLILAANNQTMNSIHVRGGIFLALFLFTVVVASIFSRGSHYKNPAISLLLIFIVQTFVIFLVLSTFNGSAIAQTLIFPFVYILGYYIFLHRDILAFIICSKLGKTGWRRYFSDNLAESTKKSITSILVLKGLRYMAILYTAYAMVDALDIYLKGIESSFSTSVGYYLGEYYSIIGRYLMDAIMLYIILILWAGVSKSIRENKDCKVDF
jgi:hypothetical protein